MKDPIKSSAEPDSNPPDNIQSKGKDMETAPVTSSYHVQISIYK